MRPLIPPLVPGSQDTPGSFRVSTRSTIESSTRTHTHTHTHTPNTAGERRQLNTLIWHRCGPDAVHMWGGEALRLVCVLPGAVLNSITLMLAFDIKLQYQQQLSPTACIARGMAMAAAYFLPSLLPTD